jgi:hypothetical protein
MTEASGDEEPPRGWLSGAKRRAAEIRQSSPAANKVVTATKTAAGQVAKTYDKGRRYVSQADAWQETEESVETLIDVVRAQHAMILDLLERVSHLERAANQNRRAGDEQREPRL